MPRLVTRKRLRWFVLVNVQSWALQATLACLLALCGVGACAALASAKGAAWLVFLGQCWQAGRET